MVVDQLIPQFEPRITNVINYHLEKYQWDESELDRLAKKLFPLLQERVINLNVARGSGPEPPVSFAPGIAEIILWRMNVKVGRGIVHGNAS